MRGLELPDAGSFNDDRLSAFDSFGSNPGNLRAKTYIPESYRKGAPLVVVLHGCTQIPSGYDRNSGWSHAADEYGFALLFPEQQRANNPNLCFNWFLRPDASRGRGEALSIRQMVAEMHARQGTDPERVYVTGLSAGGAMTAVMLATYPDIFAGGGIIAGLPFGTAQSIPEAFDRMRGHGGPNADELAEMVRSASKHDGPWPTLSIWHGSTDRTVDPGNAEDLVQQWGTLHGVTKSPTRTNRVGGYPHRVWCDAKGREVIEEYVITGMGHGAPLSTKGERSGEVAGPYMLEAGISSTRLICRFWGLCEERISRTGELAKLADDKVRTGGPTGSSRRHPPHPLAGDITKTIEDALRSAGLMR
jgi:poly(hydroxyalkanoate) depolymerase family esterase